MEEAMKLANGEISGIVETEEGYYIIKMVDDSATTSYDEAVTAAIDEAEAARFDEEFEKIKEGYDVKINEEVWDKVVLGNNTIVPVSAEDTTTTDDTAAEDTTATDDTSASDGEATEDTSKNN